MKKYRVSLATKVLCNFEVEVDAKSEKQALNLALEKWDGERSVESITDPDWSTVELDIDKKRRSKLSSGIYIEEIEK